MLEFVESLQRKEFVGSGTKFSLIFELLEKLEYEALLDTEERLASIDARIAKLQQEREKIATEEGVVDETQIKEIVSVVLALSRRLLLSQSQRFLTLFLIVKRRSKTPIRAKVFLHFGSF